MNVVDTPRRHDRRGRLVPVRAALLREMDAMLVALLAYAGPRPESEALPMTFEQIGRPTITFRATKRGVVVERETRLLEPLARDLRDSFASLLIHEGVDVVDLAPRARALGDHLPALLRAHVREFKGQSRRPAVDVIREAREAVAAGAVPAGYLPARVAHDASAGWCRRWPVARS